MCVLVLCPLHDHSRHLQEVSKAHGVSEFTQAKVSRGRQDVESAGKEPSRCGCLSVWCSCATMEGREEGREEGRKEGKKEGGKKER